MTALNDITDTQLRELRAFAKHMGDGQLESKCKLALSFISSMRGRALSVDLAREYCANAYASAIQKPEWSARHLPFGMIPYRQVDQTHQRQVAISEARRIRAALDATPPFYNIANGQIASSLEIVDALTRCIEALSS